MEDEKLLKQYLLLHFNKKEQRVEEWLDTINRLLDEKRTPRELVKEGRVKEVLNFVKICVTDELYEKY